jgi:hypothetical protein
MTVNEGCPICQGRCCEYGVDDYRGVWTAEQERKATVTYLRDCAHRDAYRNHNRNRAEALWDAANIVESGKHRREEEK